MILKKIVENVEKRYKDKLANIEDIKKLSEERIITDKEFFYRAIEKKELSFICEIKKASPSKGIISEDFDYLSIAKQYDKCADCISVLTEPDYFLGSNEYLTNVKNIVNIPILRKDFIIYEYQIYEAKAIGADAILLIVRILDDETLKKFIDIAHSIGLGCLVECHTDEEVLKASKLGARVIGVNNRNLADFTIDMNNSIKLRNLCDNSVSFVSESGIKTHEDIKLLYDNNVNAVLIGETLMKSSDIIGMVNYLKYGKN